MRFQVSVLLALVLLGSAPAAVPTPHPVLAAATGQGKAVGSSTNLYPLLRVNETVHVYFVFSPGLPPPQTERDHDLFVSRDGVTESVTTAKTFTTDPRLATSVVRGRASKRSLAALEKALGDADAGLQGDCEWPFTDPELGGAYEITWYGKNARRNRFTVHFDRGLPGNFPPCSSAASYLVSAIGQYEREVGVKRDGEI